jgi:hypothetical protein
LEALRIEFRDIAIEARKVFKKINKLGSPVAVVGTPNEDSKVPSVVSGDLEETVDLNASLDIT